MPLRRWWIIAVTLTAFAPAAAQAATSSNASELAAWEFIRASGLVAFLLLSASMLLGVAVNVRALDWLMRRAWVNEGHQTLSLLALVFMGFHVLLLLVDTYMPFTVVQVLVPLTSPWRAVPTALGTIALYLSVLLVGSSYLRPAIGHKTWRVIHYGGFAGWALALLHGVTAGGDSGESWVQYMYLLAGGSVVFLVLFRVLAWNERAAAPASVAGDQAEAAGARQVTTK